MGSDDEDLEFLRLAALKSRKAKAESENQATHNGISVGNSGYGVKEGTKPMRESRGFRGKKGHMRGVQRNGGINPRVNTNLISIPIAKNVEVENSSTKPIDKETAENPDSKFNRYDHSDQSDSESELDAKKDDSDFDLGNISDAGDSLDRLMDELESEISGKPKVKTVAKTKPVEKIKKAPVEKIEEKIEEKPIEICDTNKEIELKNQVETTEDKVEVKVVEEVKEKETSRLEEWNDDKPNTNESNPASSWKKTSYINDRRSPYDSRPTYDRHIRKYSRSPPRSYSPLCINTEVLNTITMAPLSPRSAAFVLQNREILAKRKQSPGRRSLSSRSSLSSISRSPSPRQRIVPPSRNRAHSPPRRYLTKKRSPSPIYKNEPRRRSRSPIRGNPKRFSPRPEARAQSPQRRPVVKRRSKSPINSKRVLHSRLGVRPSTKPRRAPPRSTNPENKRSMSLSLSPSPDRQKPKEPLNNLTGALKSLPVEDKVGDSKKLDPILEARKRKFESNTPVTAAVGVIKLKKDTPPNETNSQEELEPSLIDSESEENEDQNRNLSDLWSSDESDDEKEGRFKLQTTENRNTYTKRPFISTTVELKPKRMKHSKSSSYHSERRRRDNAIKPSSDENKRASHKPSDPDKSQPRPEKIRNPDVNVDNKIKTLRREKIINADVESTKVLSVNNTVKEEIDLSNENEEKSTNDDLRTELSRRRAQRKAANAPVATARIVQTAFQEMSKKSIGSTNKPIKGTKTERRVLVLKRSPLEMDQEQSPINVNSDSITNKVGVNVERGSKARVPIRMRLGKSGIENYTSTSLVSDNFTKNSLTKKHRLDDDDDDDVETIVTEKRSHGGHKKRIIALQV